MLGAGNWEDYSFEQQRGNSAYTRFRVGWNNKVSGAILDAEGNPVKRAKASVLLNRSSLLPLVVREDMFDLNYGRYGFSGLTPGKYVLSVSVSAPFKTGGESLRFFYPGVANPMEATAIPIGEKDSLTIDFKLPPGYVVRNVEGVLVWSDGSPIVENGWVGLTDSENSKDEDKKYDFNHADEQGRFSLQGFVGAVYWLHATARSGSEWLESKPVKVTVGNTDKPLRIEIPRP